MSCPSKRRSGGSVAGLLLALLAFTPSVAWAKDRVQIRPNVRVTESYDSNVLALENEEEAGLLTVLEPTLSIRSEGESGRMDFLFGLRARRYLEFKDLNSTESRTNLDFSRRLTRRLSISGGARFDDQPKRDPSEGDGLRVQSGRPDSRQSSLNAGLSYQLTPRASLASSLTFGLSEFGEDPSSGSRLRDSQFRSESLTYRYLLGPRDIASLSLSRSDVEVDGIPAVGVGASESQTTSLIASWSRTWSKRWATSFGIGTRQLQSRNESVGTTSSGSETDSRAFQGSASITGALPRGAFSLALSSETRPSSSGSGGSRDFRSASLSYSHRLSRAWTLGLSASVAASEDASDLTTTFDVNNIQDLVTCSGLLGQFGGTFFPPGPGQPARCSFRNDSQGESSVAALRMNLSWQVRRRLSAFFSYSFRDQSTSDSSSSLRAQSISSSDRETKNHVISIGFRYDFKIDVP